MLLLDDAVFVFIFLARFSGFPRLELLTIIRFILLYCSHFTFNYPPFKEAQKLSVHLQDEIAHQLLEAIHNELKWQETLANPKMDLGVFQAMAQAALIQEEKGETEEKGFGEE